MCGEHLPLSLITMATWGSSPHVRGARLAGDLPVDCRGIIPACAGSTYPEDDEAGFQRDHPRMCGEHIRVSSRALSSLGSSPHVRGARPRQQPGIRPNGIIPACAGSTLSRPTRWRQARDHPRMCGEHFQPFTAVHGFRGSSPHVRGALIRFSTKNIGRRDHPRMCGEHPKTANSRYMSRGSSPHVRGALDSAGDFLGCVGIIPACAGSTPFWSLWETSCRDHPRMCGEHVWLRYGYYVQRGSSPHVRGAPRHSRPPQCQRGIIPACAGSTPTATSNSRGSRDHPRMCGEHMSIERLYCPSRGSSPHVRGAREVRRFRHLERGIIPACAGST